MGFNIDNHTQLPRNASTCESSINARFSVDINENHRVLELYPQQLEAFNQVRDFLKSDDSVFILKGYAGTGKTTLVKAMLTLINSCNKVAYLLAPTGRAANILRQKTNFPASTIHRQIYSGADLKALRHDEKGDLIETYKTNELDKDSINDVKFNIISLGQRF